MALTKRGQYLYGSKPEDLREAVISFTRDAYPAEQFRASVCQCGNQAFLLETDEIEGVAVRICSVCGDRHIMGDGADYVDDAHLERRACVCGGEIFNLLTGVALYEGSNDVKWNYVGCHCTGCDLVGVLADWKCEAGDAGAFLDNV